MNNGGGVVFFSLTITSFVVSVSPVRILQSSSKAESSLSSDSPSSVVSAPRNASNPLSVVFLARAQKDSSLPASPQVCNYLMLTSISGHVMLTLLPIFTVTFVNVLEGKLFW